MPETPDATPHPVEPGRKEVTSRAANIAMAAGLCAGYGAFAGLAMRFLYPAKPELREWMFVARVSDLSAAGSMSYATPAGARVNIAKRGAGTAAEDFIALSSTCPHLGCQVHWVAVDKRFFCPCHNGAFDPEGKAIAGPPAEGGQSLPRYPLRVEAGLLYIEVPVERLARVPADEVITGPGHDPCLGQRPLAPDHGAQGQSEVQHG